MEHNFRWLKTRLNLDTLESRMQPGSLFTSGIDLGSVADVIARPETTSARQIKKLDSQDIQIVGSGAGNHIVQTENVVAPKGAETQNQTSRLGLENRPTSTSVNPVVAQPKVASKDGQIINVQTHLDSRNLEIKSAPLQAAATHRPTVAFTGGEGGQIVAKHMDNITTRIVPCDSSVVGDGSRIQDGSVTNFTYVDKDTTGAAEGPASRAYGNASGKGGNLGTQYIVGERGGDGLVMRLPAAGACTALLIDAGADPVRMNDAHGNSGGLVVVGTIDSVDDVAILARLDNTTLAVQAGAGVWGYGAAGLDLSLESVGLRAGGPAIPDNIATSGALLDKTSGTKFTFNAAHNDTLTVLDVVPQVNYTYLDITSGTVPVNCTTNGVDMDRASPAATVGNSLLSIACDETASPTAGFTNVFARIDSDHSSTADITYGVTLWDGGGFTALPGAGNLGGRLLQGPQSPPGVAPLPGGMRTVGAFDGTTFNPGFLSSLNVKWTDLGNPAGPTFTGAFWFVAGADFYGTDVVTQRPDTGLGLQSRSFVATTIGLAGDHGAFSIEYADDPITGDGFAAFVSGYGVDTIGTEETAYGIDSVSGAPYTGIQLAGSNDGDLGAFGSACDDSWNGGLDGFGLGLGQIPG